MDDSMASNETGGWVSLYHRPQHRTFIVRTGPPSRFDQRGCLAHDRTMSRPGAWDVWLWGDGTIAVVEVVLDYCGSPVSLPEHLISLDMIGDPTIWPSQSIPGYLHIHNPPESHSSNSDPRAESFEERLERCSATVREMVGFMKALCTNLGHDLLPPTYEANGGGITFWRGNRRFCRLDPKTHADHVWVMLPGAEPSDLEHVASVSPRDDGPWMTIDSMRDAVRLVPHIIESYERLGPKS